MSETWYVVPAHAALQKSLRLRGEPANPADDEPLMVLLQAEAGPLGRSKKRLPRLASDRKAK